MQVGLMAPQGWKGDYDGWPPGDACTDRGAGAPGGRARLRVAVGLRPLPYRPRGQGRDHLRVVLRAGRSGDGDVAGAAGAHGGLHGLWNPALTAKLSSTLDVISGGRFELGIGAGWKKDEWIAYGYGFPALSERLDTLGDHLAIISEMFVPGRSTYEGEYALVRGAINVPQGLQQPRIPIIVGGNGRERTAGYAIRYADELNFVFIEPDDIAERMRDVRDRCAAEGRDRDDALLAVRATT